MVVGARMMAGNRHLAMQLNKRQTRTHHAASCRHPQPQFTSPRTKDEEQGGVYKHQCINARHNE